MYKKFEMELAGRTLRVDVDRVAKQANGAVLMHYGDTTVLCTATASEKPREGIDFFPLSVEYNERMYAVGKIPGGFNKREGKASENAVLTDRVIDRPMRPLFPKDLRNDVSIVCTVLENDYDNSPEVVALLGASIAVSISDIPFDYVVAGCQVGIVDGKTVINPTSEQRAASEMDVTLCATKDKIVMIEAGAKEVPEDDMFNALMEAHEELKKVCAFIQSIKDEIGKPKFEYEHHDIDHDLFDKLEAACNDKFEVAMDTDDKTVRDAGVRAIVDEFEATLDEEYKEEHGANLGECVDKLQKKIVRRWLANGKRRRPWHGRGSSAGCRGSRSAARTRFRHVHPRSDSGSDALHPGYSGRCAGAGHHLRGEGEALYPPLQLPVLLCWRNPSVPRSRPS